MATLTLRPNGAGNQQGWDAEGGDWQRVDESSSDGDTTRLYSPTDNRVATFALENKTTEEGVINSVTVYIYTRGIDPISNVVQLAIRTGGTDYFSSDNTYNNTSYHNESNTWSTNPGTSAAWTWSEIDALEAGMKRISGGGQAVTQVWVEVDYTPASWEQEGFRFYNDDGDEDASTALAAQDTNVSVAEGVTKRLRLLLNTTGTTDPIRFILYYKKSTDGTYTKVPTSGTSEAFTIVASTYISASGENTTARLTAPSGKSTSDFDAGRIQDDENPADSVTVSADDYTEMEWTLQANAAAVDGGVYQFRAYRYLETFAPELTTGGTASALGENEPNEGDEEAFDDSADTKWLHFTGSATWLKYDLGSGVTKLVTKYAVTSANDDDTRDPKDWELQGSNDDSSWTTVDTITGETFASRKLRKEYTCDTPGTTAYRYWRFYINANNGNGSITQLAEIQLYQLADPTALTTYTVTPEWTIGSGSTAYDVVAALGTFTLTGQNAGLSHGTKTESGAGTFTLAGQNAGLSHGTNIAADQGTYALTGQDANLSLATTLALEAGVLTLTGNDVNFTTGFVLACDAGSYTITGQDATFNLGLTMALERGTFSIAGQDVGLSYGTRIDAATGTFVMTGQDANLSTQYVVLTEKGGYILTGQDAALTFSQIMTAEKCTFTLTGNDAALPISYKINPETGTFTLTGNNVNLGFSSPSGAGHIIIGIAI